jgi:D-sedoheptulose 7-phosphate isomerase
MNNKWFSEYFNLYQKVLFVEGNTEMLVQLKDMLTEMQKAGKKALVMGNGASASIASHISTDLTKGAGIRTTNFNDANLITALGNDFGYEKWMGKALEMYADKDDVAILVSSSGTSPNVVFAANTARTIGMKVVTLSGFSENNPLKLSGDLNLWVNSKAYNIIENVHMIWLTAVCDAIIGNAEYSVN